MSTPTPREVWRAAYERFTTAPRGTAWPELVRLASIEKECWRELVREQREKTTTSTTEAAHGER